MRFLFLAALLAAPLAACDTDSSRPAPNAPAPVVARMVVTDVAGNVLGTLGASEIDSVLAAAPDAPLASELTVPSLAFPGGGGGTLPSSSASLAVSPSPFADEVSLELELPVRDRVRLFLLPAVTREGARPPAIRAGALAETPDGFPGLVLADGPSGGTTLFVELDPRELGMDYGLYRFVLLADDEREEQDVLYAPCAGGVIAGLPLC